MRSIHDTLLRTVRQALSNDGATAVPSEVPQEMQCLLAELDRPARPDRADDRLSATAESGPGKSKM